jgi:hypothetical protein
MRATTPQPVSAAASATIPRILISVILPGPGAIQAQPAVDDKGERTKAAGEGLALEVAVSEDYYGLPLVRPIFDFAVIKFCICGLFNAVTILVEYRKRSIDVAHLAGINP